MQLLTVLLFLLACTLADDANDTCKSTFVIHLNIDFERLIQRVVANVKGQNPKNLKDQAPSSLSSALRAKSL